MTAPWYRDPVLYEYLSTDTFWLIGIFIVANAIWTIRQVERTSGTDNESKESENETEAADTSSKTDPSSDGEPLPSVSYHHHISMWLQPHITSFPRKVLAITACSLVVLAQLLEGSWILRTTWRFTVSALKATYPRWKPWVLGFVVYSPVTGVILATWAGVLFTGVFVVVMQVIYIIDLCELEPGSRLRQHVDKNKRGPDEREWEEIGSTEVRKSGEKSDEKEKSS